MTQNFHVTWLQQQQPNFRLQAISAVWALWWKETYGNKSSSWLHGKLFTTKKLKGCLYRWAFLYCKTRENYGFKYVSAIRGSKHYNSTNLRCWLKIFRYEITVYQANWPPSNKAKSNSYNYDYVTCYHKVRFQPPRSYS